MGRAAQGLLAVAGAPGPDEGRRGERQGGGPQRRARAGGEAEPPGAGDAAGEGGARRCGRRASQGAEGPGGPAGSASSKANGDLHGQRHFGQREQCGSRASATSGVCAWRQEVQEKAMRGICGPRSGGLWHSRWLRCSSASAKPAAGVQTGEGQGSGGAACSASTGGNAPGAFAAAASGSASVDRSSPGHADVDGRRRTGRCAGRCRNGASA